jgi:hypothetical protein
MIPYEVYIFVWIVQFAGLKARQAAAGYYNGVGAELLDFSDGLSAFCRGGMCNATCVNHNQIGLHPRILDLVESQPFKQFSNLLALVLIDFATKSVYGKGSNHVV